MDWIRWFSETGIDDIDSVGGKNASLGEMIRELHPLGIRVPDGFSITAGAYRRFLESNSLESKIREELSGIEEGNVAQLKSRAAQVRQLMGAGELPLDLIEEIQSSYGELSRKGGVEKIHVAVRSSATAEDLPNASFAGQQETYLMVHGVAELLDAVKRAFASLFTARAINYRNRMGFDHFQTALSVGVQQMVRSDLSASGVMFTLDTESGFRNVVLVTSSYGLGENIVQGKIVPDEFYVHKTMLAQGFEPILRKKLGAKRLKLVYNEADHSQANIATPQKDQDRFSLSDPDLLQLARWGVAIEDHYSRKRGVDTPMDIEWTRDGLTGQLFIVQARPETVHSQKTTGLIREYRLKGTGKVIAEGLPVGNSIATGDAKVLTDLDKMDEFKEGEVLVTENTDPDWEPIMKLASAIVTERGGRTSHAAIVARELGVPAVVGSFDATKEIHTGRTITVSAAEGDVGRVYGGAIDFEVHEIDPFSLPRPKTKIMLNVGTPEKAFSSALLPNDGVGLARIEFIFASWVRLHPLALTRYHELPEDIKIQVDEITAGYGRKTDYFVDKLAQGIGTIAGAFWPNPVILRFSDFKTNEYAHLLGGEQFEPKEENPMLGWRGASRYYHPDYKDGFMLEVAAVKRVRETFGLTNLKVMIPFCRTPDQGRKVLEVMAEGGLVQGENDLEVYVMAELPSNIWLAAEFAEIFDGFSIGTNDLTQLTLGVDRDSARIADLFDECNEAVMQSCATLIREAAKKGKKVGICGQAPSDYPDFAAFLVKEGIDSISINPDAVMATTKSVLEMEDRLSTIPITEASAKGR